MIDRWRPHPVAPPRSRSRLRTRLAARLAAGWALVILGGCSSDRYLSFLNPQGPVAEAQRTHFLWALGILFVFVALPIFVFLPCVLWRYRYNATASHYRPRWKSSLPIEFMMWAGPVVIVIVLSVMVWNSAHDLDPYQPVAAKQEDIRIQAIGYDWKWLFIYPDQGIASVGVLALPVNQPVAMRLTSAATMQSLHVPALTSQIYAMGGMVTQLHFMADRPGRSLGTNNMFNGKGFHKQRFTAVAMPRNDFDAWVERVRQQGTPMTPEAYDALARFNNVSELTGLLPQASHNGHVYFTQVSENLFPAVVSAIMSGSRLRLKQVLQSTPGRAPLASRDEAPPLETAQ